MTYHITIDGEISPWGYSKTYVRNLLAQYKGKHVDMRISSLGGDLSHGLDIRQQLIDHGDVTAYIYGFTASSATVIAMGAKRICMSKYALFLVHKCSNYIDVWGRYNADELAKLIEQLETNKRENDKIDIVLAQMYAEKCGKKVSDLMDLLKTGGWLNADEALKWGFVDEIVEDDASAKLDMTDELLQKFAAYSLPVDGLPMPTHTAHEEADTPDGHQPLLRQILDTLRSWIPGKPAVQAQDTPTDQAQPDPINPVDDTMTKIAVYSAIMATLAVQSLAVNEDGSVTMSQDDLERINDALRLRSADISDRDNTIAARDKTIADLKAQIEVLKKLPGDDTAGIVDDCSDECMSTDEVYNLIKDL